MIANIRAVKLLRLIDELNKLDQEYLADPDYKKFAQGFLGKASYSFDDDLLPIYEKMLEREKDVATLTEQEANAYAELQSKKRAAQATIEAYQNKNEKKRRIDRIKRQAKGGYRRIARASF